MQIAPRQLSHELRNHDDPELDRRRWIVEPSLFGAAVGGIVGAFQMDMLRRLPDPPVGPFDSTRVEASPYAYKRLATPDGQLMLASYGVTAVLAGAGGARRAETTPLLPLAMGPSSPTTPAPC